jgi:hypothetical protein
LKFFHETTEPGVETRVVGCVAKAAHG